MKKVLNSEKGFTLIEVMIVIVLIAVIGAIAVPASGIVHRSRVKDTALQIVMDVQKISFFAKTHTNVRTGSDYEYRITFEDSLSINGKTYYKRYKFAGGELGNIKPMEEDNYVLLRPVFKEASGAEKLIKDIQFDNRGRIYLKYSDGSYDNYSALSSLPSNEIIAIVKAKANDFEKKVKIRPLTAKAFVTE